MNQDHVHKRLRDALHRGNSKATEAELVEVTAVILAVMAEVTSELAAVIGELEARVAALEKK